MKLPSGRLNGAVRVPGSKSLTNRALLLAALADGESTLGHPLDADDTRTLAAALELLGARVSVGPDAWRVAGPLRPGSTAGATAPGRDELVIDVGPAGTPARFLLALLAALPGTFVLDGSPRMRLRPMGLLVDALRSLGARIEAVDREGFLPLRIQGGELRGGRVTIRGDVSSQFLSALLLVGPLLPGGLELDVVGPVSSAFYLDLTRQALDVFTSEGRYRPARYEVPGDDSAACFPIAGAVVSAGRVLVEGLARESRQPDAVFRDWAARTGARVEWSEGGLLVSRDPGEPVRPLAVDVDPAPDAALPLAALLAVASGRSRLLGVARLREKESDRLAAAQDLLTRAGIAARVEGPPGGPELIVEGGVPRAAAFAAHGDHRVAMAAAVLALAAPSGSTLDQPEVVAKSYPAFFGDWGRLVGEGPAS